MNNLTRVAHRMVNRPLMIEPGKLDVLVQALGPRLGITPGDKLALEEPLASAYMDQAEDREYQVVDGIAVIPITGVLTKKDSFMSAWSGCSSYEQIGRLFQQAINDRGVRAILLQADSPGGETTGCLELSDFIYSQRGAKPIYGIADDFAFSACYALLSAADRIFVTRMGSVGSIGVVMCHSEQSEWDKQTGLKFTYIFEGNKKVDGNPHEPLSDGAQSDMQSETRRQYDQFVATVVRNRKATTAQIEATQAGLFWSDKSIPLLADEVGTFDNCLNALRSEIGAPITAGAMALAGVQMKNAPKPASTPAATAPPVVEPAAVLPVPPVTASTEGDEDEEDTPDGTDSTDSSFCHACGTQLHQDAKYCHACGTPDSGEPSGKFCDNCGADTRKGAKFCQGCGQAVKAGDPAASAVAPVAALAGISAVAISSRPESDIVSITALCNAAGCPEKVGHYMSAKTTAGKFFSVTEVSDILTTARVAETEKTMVNTQVSPAAGTGGIKELEAQATAFAAQNRGKATPPAYVNGPAVKMTKERAYAQMLEEHPEAYGEYVDQHNAQGLVGRLQKAGYKLTR